MGIGIIGGSGIYELEGVEKIDSYKMDTPFGRPSDEIHKGMLGGATFYFLSRHGKGHRWNPSEVNYRANIYALKKLGVKNVISVSAVGSLKEEIKPGDIVLPDQFIDWTKGLRKRTFFENGAVGHVSLAEPVEKKLVNKIFQYKDHVEVNFHLGGTYICIEGPQFSTKAESNLYKGFGASIIGMTNVPESYLAKEAGMAYATMALVTDYDSWKEEATSLEDILKTLNENTRHAKKILVHIIPEIGKNPVEYKKGNTNSIVTNREEVPSDIEETLRIILS